MFKSMAISPTQNGTVLYIDGAAVLAAGRIADAKYFSGQCGVAAVYVKNGKTNIVFITKAADVPGEFLKRHIALDPQPRWGTRTILEISRATDLPFAHYSAENGYMYVVTQCGVTGPFKRQEDERLLEHMRKEIRCFYVMKK